MGGIADVLTAAQSHERSALMQRGLMFEIVNSDLFGESSRQMADILRASVLRLPTTVIDGLRVDIEPLEHPWNTAYAPRVSSAAIDHVRDIVTYALYDDGGRAIITGDGLANLSDNFLAGFHLAIACALGQPVGQNGAKETLVEVRAFHAPGTPGVRGYQDNDRMLLHSDAADFSGLMCLSQGDSGGTSLFASALDIHDILAEEAPELIGYYYNNWWWNVGALGFPGVERPISMPIFSVRRGRLSCRYSSSLLRGGAIAAGESLTDAQVRALDLFEEVALRDGVVTRYRLSRGESVWMNNQTLLHGRDAFRDDDGTDRTRRLLRAWSRSASARQRWPRVAAFDDQLFQGLRA